MSFHVHKSDVYNLFVNLGINFFDFRNSQI